MTLGTMKEIEKQVYAELLAKYQGNRTHVADHLRVNLRTVRSKIKLYGLEKVGVIET